MRLIDLDSLPSGRIEWENIVDAPIIDAVPVVRCKDCTYWTKQSHSLQGRCALSGSYPTGAWYCANGERREE